jgi:hypothetical protein
MAGDPNSRTSVKPAGKVTTCDAGVTRFAFLEHSFLRESLGRRY